MQLNNPFQTWELDKVCYNNNVKAWTDKELSKSNSGEEISSSKRDHTLAGRPNDNLYARQRRLEQRIERIESGLSTLRRDVYRIEKKQYREKETPSQIAKSAGQGVEFPAGLFT